MLIHAERKPQLIPTRNWLTLGLITILLTVPIVLVTQAIAVSIWPDIRLFDPLSSFPRSALFTLVPVLAATALFAFLEGRVAKPAKLFMQISIAVLVLSFIPDYLLPVANKTLLASTVAAFLHLVAGLITLTVLQLGYKELHPAA